MVNTIVKTLHRLKAILIPNSLTGKTGDYYAKVISESTLTIMDICISAVERGNAPTSVDAMRNNVEQFLKEMAYRLKDGFSVNTGYFTATPLIKGVFTSALDKFDSSKHLLLFNFNQGELLRKELMDIVVEIVGESEGSLMIAETVDVKTGSVNDRITPNRNLRIRGHKLKIAGDDDKVGVSFINEGTGVETKVDNVDIVENKPSELMIVTPQLPDGVYSLKVSSQYSGHSLLKEPRTVVFDKPLTAVN
jgi:hypothetical protein